jgi:hypothetical protein
MRLVGEHKGRGCEGKQHAGANDGHAEVRLKESQYPFSPCLPGFILWTAGGESYSPRSRSRFRHPVSCPRICFASTAMLEADF